jgi:hypothetical protein
MSLPPSIPPPSASWSSLGNTFYKKQSIFTLSSSELESKLAVPPGGTGNEIQDWKISAERNGGLIAIRRDQRMGFILSGGTAMGKESKTVWVFSGSGKMVGSVYVSLST